MADDASAPTLGQKWSLIGYKLLCSVLRCCDVRFVAVLGRCIGYLVWMASPGRRRIVARNLRIAVDPMLRADKLRPMVRRNMVRTTMNLACSLKTGLMTPKEMERSIRMEGAELFESHGVDGHTVVSCIPHAGNWEILARIRPHFKKVEHFSSMYRRLSNPLLEDFVYRSRTRYGCEMYSKENGLKAVLKLAKVGGLMGVLSDQFTQEGLFLPYFGKVTGVTPLPALLYKRCKGKGTLHSVFTRNVGLGKWVAELGRVIELPEGCDTVTAITMQVNLALEKCQLENILDGFWMHHRWKVTDHFIPLQDVETFNQTTKEILQYRKLPFRIMVAMPESFEEAALLLPIVHTFATCRVDAEVTVLCPTEQAEFWRVIKEVVHVVTTDGTHPVLEQLDADEIYKGGPFDILFMFSESKKLMKDLQALRPLYVTGFSGNPLARQFKFDSTGTELHTGAPIHRVEIYQKMLNACHRLIPTEWKAICRGNKQAQGTFIAPFSTLGDADGWPESKWAELAARLPEKPVLLALKADEGKAAAMAERLGIPCRCVQPHELLDVLGANTKLYTVDGLISEIANIAKCPSTVIMASRLKESYGPIGDWNRILFRHLPCHPCYRKQCDMQQHCTDEISVDDMLGTTSTEPNA